jgi:oligoendopeptidase F
MALALATSGDDFHVDLARFFASPAAEAQDRTALARDVSAFIASATPGQPDALHAWLQRSDALLERLQRHDAYVYLRSEEDQDDAADARADDELGTLIDRVRDRVVVAAQQLGRERIASLTQSASLAPFRYLLDDAFAQGEHRLDSARSDAVNVVTSPVLEAAASSYKALRKTPDPIATHQDAYAALLVSIAAARNGVAHLRGFRGAADAAYFDRGLSPQSVDRTLAAVRASTAYARYRRVASGAPAPAFHPAPIPIAEAIPLILAAEEPMGQVYAQAYRDLLAPENNRLEICTAKQCDDTGFSLGFAGLDSVAYFGNYSGTVDSVRAVAHESGHAVHRELMSRGQPIAAYNAGPHFVFESFAIFNELLFLDRLVRTAPNDAQRAYYANLFLDDATFQVFGSAEETELEAAIYRGVAGGKVKTAPDFDALATAVFGRYDPSSSKDPATAVYWAHNRLYYTDPLYDVNYLYAGLLALAYFTRFEHDAPAFSRHYVALLGNGFDDTPAALERRFLGIDLSDEAGLVATATRFIDARTADLEGLYAKLTPAR